MLTQNPKPSLLCNHSLDLDKFKIFTIKLIIIKNVKTNKKNWENTGIELAETYKKDDFRQFFKETEQKITRNALQIIKILTVEKQISAFSKIPFEQKKRKRKHRLLNL